MPEISDDSRMTVQIITDFFYQPDGIKLATRLSSFYMDVHTKNVPAATLTCQENAME
jgi:hypothetical protein